MELKIPSPEQAYWGLRAMKTVAMADGALDDSERHMMEAIQRIFGTTYTVEELAPITPAELARSLPDPQIRRQLVHGLIVMSLIDREASPQETDLVEQFAQALEVSVPEVKDREGLLSFGADEVLEKPVLVEALVEKVRGWIARGRRPTPVRELRNRLEPA